MSTSKSKMFFSLYAKDMRESLPEIIVVAALAVALNGILYLRVIQSEAAAKLNAFILIPVLMVMGLAVFLPLISSFKLLGKEWSNNTVYLIMSLPVSGAMILGSKLLALLTQYVAGTLIAGITGFILIWDVVPLRDIVTGLIQVISAQPQRLTWILLFYLLSAVFIIFLISVSFFSQIVGRLSARFSGFITGVMFFFTLYIVGKINDFGFTINFRELSMFATPTGLLLAANMMVLLIAAIIFVLGAVIYDRKVEL